MEMVQISDEWRRAAELISLINKGEAAASAAAAAGDQQMAWLWLVVVAELSQKLSVAMEGAVTELGPVQVQG